ncbi:MAG: hypothetical protein DLM57_17165 [Pseudonocardiales bacterium]|nr:MAG: hypothetical protein DLM57_17165 [Pseudonocardiales bacterium]
MNRETEHRLRAAFEAKAAQVTPATLSPGHPPTDQDLSGDQGRRKLTFQHRWVAPLLAAAAVVTVVAGGAVIAGTSTAHHLNPADATTTPSTSAPASPQTPTTSPTHKATEPVVHPTPGSTSHPVPLTSDVVPPSLPRHGPTVVDFAGVGVTLPVGWSQFPGPASAAGITNTWCASSDDTRCDLYIVRAGADTAALIIDDAVVGQRCGDNSVTAYSQRSIAGQSVEYRTFRAGCAVPAGEQWFVPTNPQIVFWHPLGVNDAIVEQAVAGATLPAALGPLPARDRGFLQSVTRGSDGYHVTMQREVDLPSGAIPEPGRQSTYSFVVPLNNSLQTSCSEWKIPGYQPFQHCDLSVLVTQSAKGAHPTDGTLAINSVQMVLWSDGKTIGVLQTRDTFPGG